MATLQSTSSLIMMMMMITVLLLLLDIPVTLSSSAAPADNIKTKDQYLINNDPSLALEVSDAAEQSFIATWVSSKLPGPPPISNEEQLSDIGPFISPVLSGDLGSMMFQLAAVHVLAQNYSTPCVVAWWDQSDTSLPEQYRPFGGRGEPAPGITLKHTFPALVYVFFEPSYRGVRSNHLSRGDKGSVV
jgi:hypothetical protein